MRAPLSLRRLLTRLSHFADTVSEVMEPENYRIGLHPSFCEEVLARFWQHPVGQGFFHSGFIQLSGQPPFRYVYDCGKAGAKAAHWPRLIGVALTDYDPRPLDALFISHFDKDHINGLPELLAGFGGAKLAFLPYLTPMRRLVLAARAVARGDQLDDSYREFLAAPAPWLLAQNVSKVVMVGGRDQREELDVPIPPNPEGKTSDSAKTIALEIKDTDVGNVFQVAPQDEVTPGDTQRIRQLDHRFPLLLRSRAGDPAWIFQTYVDPDKESEAAILQAVSEALGEDMKIGIQSGEQPCNDVLSDSKHLNALAAAYKRAKNQRPKFKLVSLFAGRKKLATDASFMNRTTLTLFSGPWAFQKRLLTKHTFEGLPGYRRAARRLNAIGNQRNGWLLTGDATLNDKDILCRHRSFFSDAATDYLQKTAVLTVPHHGSKQNFSALGLRELGMPPIAVIPAGNRSHYGHPHGEVLDALERHGVTAFHVHDADSSGLQHWIGSFVWR